jgi:hypothetical protein
LLFTTGKGKSIACRQMARALFCAVPSSELVGRGKRSLSSLLSKAAKQHGGRVCAIYAGKEAACEIAFLLSDAHGGFEWLSPRVAIKKISFAAPGKYAMSSCLKLSGTKSRVLAGLLPSQDCEGGVPESEIKASATSLSIFVQGKLVLRAGVSYEKQDE